MEKINPEIFRAYDVRGLYPREINDRVVYKIAQAYAKLFKPKEVVLGRDVRISSPSLSKSMEKGFIDAGVDVIDIGVIITDMLYFTVAYYKYPGGIVITGSHNPKEYNGIKIVKEKAAPVSEGSGMEELKDIVLADKKFRAKNPGQVKTKDIESDYIKHVLSFIDKDKIKSFKVVVNPNYGAGGKIIEKIGKKLNLDLIKINFEANGEFPVPEGRPDPLIPANRKATGEKIRENGADFGISWDSDGDRCFFLDENGQFLSGYLTTAILAEYFLKKEREGKVIYCPRLIWAVEEAVKKTGGEPILSKVGHAYFKKSMRENEAIFGGEMSGHYYFKDNFYADNGMIPFVVMLEILSRSGKKISELYAPLKEKYFFIDETNFEVKEADKLLAEIKTKYSDGKISELDGVSIEYPDWRANLRSSNTEPLVRLNVEARRPQILAEKVEELKEIIKKFEE